MSEFEEARALKLRSVDVNDEDGFDIGADWAYKWCFKNLNRMIHIEQLTQEAEALALIMSYITDKANGKDECHQMATNALTRWRAFKKD